MIFNLKCLFRDIRSLIQGTFSAIEMKQPSLLMDVTVRRMMFGSRNFITKPLTFRTMPPHFTVYGTSNMGMQQIFSIGRRLSVCKNDFSNVMEVLIFTLQNSTRQYYDTVS